MTGHTNSNYKRAGTAILVSDKIDFKTRNVTGDNEGHFIITKATVHHEDVIIISVYTPNNRDIKGRKNWELKGEINNSLIIVEISIFHFQ